MTRATFTNLSVDGMNIAASHHVTVSDSECSAFVSSQISHPDCIQLWSRAGQGMTTDITLLRNRSIGDMQGFTAFGSAKDGGYERVTVIGNYAATTYPQGVAIYDCSDCVVKDNVGVTPRGAVGACWSMRPTASAAPSRTTSPACDPTAVRKRSRRVPCPASIGDRPDP